MAAELITNEEAVTRIKEGAADFPAQMIDIPVLACVGSCGMRWCLPVRLFSREKDWGALATLENAAKDAGWTELREGYWSCSGCSHSS